MFGSKIMGYIKNLCCMRLFIVSLLIIVTASFYSCKKKTEGCPSSIFDYERYSFIEILVHDESSTILGKWKLIAARCGGFCSPFGNFDYCQHNIVFEFKPNGVLTILGNTEQPHLNPWLKEGDGFYSIESPPNNVSRDDISIKIGSPSLPRGWNYLCWFDSKRMRLYTVSEGPWYYFIKIK